MMKKKNFKLKMIKKRVAIFLDREGTLNKAYIKNGLPISHPSFNKFKILPGVKNSIIKLKKLGFLCLLITNQPDVSRKKIKKNVVKKMNNFIKKKIKLDDVFVCYHDDKHNCNCRKPKPGLLLDGSRKWNINLKESYMIGDRWKDISAGVSAGCKTIFINNKYKELTPQNPNYVTDSLIKAAQFIEKEVA